MLNLRMCACKGSIAAAVALLVAIAVPVASQAAPTPSPSTRPAAPPTAPPIDPRASSLVRAASDYLNKQSSYGFQAQIADDDVFPPAFKIQYHALAQVMERRPSDLAFIFTGDRRQVNVYANATSLTLYDRAANVYGSVPASATLESTLRQTLQTYDFSLPLSDFMYADLYGTLMRNVKTGYYIGKSTVAGVTTSHLAFSQTDIDWQIWIQDGDQPLVRELVINYKQLPGAPEYTAIFTQWDFKAYDDSVFAFTPPAGAGQIKFLKPHNGETTFPPPPKSK